MKSRPRSAENRCAEELSKALKLCDIDFTFERIPVIGREGPDITYPNPLNLVIDIKTRKGVSKKLFDPFCFHRSYSTSLYSIAQLKNISALWTPTPIVSQWNSVPVERWLDHIGVWAADHDAIPCLILHRPYMDYQDSAVIIWRADKLSLRVNAETAMLLSLPDAYRQTSGKFGGTSGRAHNYS